MALFLSRCFAIAGLTLAAALFGFFFAWVCSTMWGLDAADPRLAIGAMQAMNASVRNAVFAPVFFATGPVLMLAGGLAFVAARRGAAGLLGLGGLMILGLATILTMLVNVPMNDALAQVVIPQDPAEAQTIWAAYSPPWQLWNQIRTVTSGVGFLIALWGLIQLFHPNRP